MSYSLGEIEVLCRKAAKGAGFTWGEAEEAGQAMRILAASQLPAVEAFSAYLQSPTSHECPIRLGCELVDGVNLGVFSSAHPLLLMPFVARIAASQEAPLSLIGDSFEAVAMPDLTIIASRVSDASTGLQLTKAAPQQGLSRIYRAQASEDDLARLNEFAHRTYAPETEARKRSGAGAGDDGNV